MKKILLLALAVVVFTPSRAANPKEYQVTGAVVALTDDVITVDKNGEKWEIARTPATKVDGQLAVGQRVTVYYRMAATSIDVKNADAALTKAEKAAKKADEAAEKTRQKAK